MDAVPSLICYAPHSLLVIRKTTLDQLVGCHIACICDWQRSRLSSSAFLELQPDGAAMRMFGLCLRAVEFAGLALSSNPLTKLPTSLSVLGSPDILMYAVGAMVWSKTRPRHAGTHGFQGRYGPDSLSGCTQLKGSKYAGATLHYLVLCGVST